MVNLFNLLFPISFLIESFLETLRMHPPVGSIGRVVTKDYKIPDTNITLPKGLNIMIPVYAIHYDPEYYPEPERFMPERFTKDEIINRDKMTYLPFGEGPRVCIGMRFAMMNVKVGLVSLLRNYEFSKCAQTNVTYIERGVVMNPGGNTTLNIKRIKKNE